ncbi:MAG: AI-2E family transporter [Chloroflexi bacterium]|nr:AI-2E family transporter [Chloroflexota bacterium]
MPTDPLDLAPQPATAPPDQTPDYPFEWSAWTKRIIAIILLVVGVWSLNLLAPIVSVLILSAILTFLLFIPTLVIARRTRLNYGSAALLVYVTYVLIIVFAVVNFLPQAIETTNVLVDNVRAGAEDLTAFLSDYEPEDGMIQLAGQDVDLDFIFSPLSDSVREIESALSGESGDGETPNFGVLFEGALAATQVVSSALSGLGNFLTNLFIVHLITLLFLLEIPKAYETLHRIRSAAQRREYLIVLARVYRVWTQFFEVQVITGVIIGVLTWGQFVVMGIPNAVVVGVFTGLTSLIPNIGGFFALVPIGLIPLFEGSSVFTELSPITLSLLVVGINFGFQMVFWNVIVPKITSDALELALPVIILGVFIGAAFGGILGAFLVVPIIGSLRVLLIYLLRKLRGGDPYPGEPEPTMFAIELLGPDHMHHDAEPAHIDSAR